MEVRLGQWQQENGLGHGWVAGLEVGQQEGRSLSLHDIRETVWDKLPQGWGYTTPHYETRKTYAKDVQSLYSVTLMKGHYGWKLLSGNRKCPLCKMESVDVEDKAVGISTVFT